MEKLRIRPILRTKYIAVSMCLSAIILKGNKRLVLYIADVGLFGAHLQYLKETSRENTAI